VTEQLALGQVRVDSTAIQSDKRPATKLLVQSVQSVDEHFLARPRLTRDQRGQAAESRDPHDPTEDREHLSAPADHTQTLHHARNLLVLDAPVRLRVHEPLERAGKFQREFRLPAVENVERAGKRS
jgi:hypothetical protein